MDIKVPLKEFPNEKPQMAWSIGRGWYMPDTWTINPSHSRYKELYKKYGPKV